MTRPTTPADPMPRELSYDRVAWDQDHTPAEWELIAQALTADGRRAEQEKADSWERSDTDGFLSQWASGLTSSANQTAAELARNHGLAEFPVLLNLDGSIASVHRGYGQYGAWWRLDGAAAARYGKQFISEPKCKTNARDIASLEKRGFRIGTMRARGRVKMSGGGTGLAGAMSVHPYVELILPLAKAGAWVEVISQTSPWHAWMEDRDRKEAEYAAAEKAAKAAEKNGQGNHA